MLLTHSSKAISIQKQIFCVWSRTVESKTFPTLTSRETSPLYTSCSTYVARTLIFPYPCACVWCASAYHPSRYLDRSSVCRRRGGSQSRAGCDVSWRGEIGWWAQACNSCRRSVERVKAISNLRPNSPHLKWAAARLAALLLSLLKFYRNKFLLKQLNC